MIKEKKMDKVMGIKVWLGAKRLVRIELGKKKQRKKDWPRASSKSLAILIEGLKLYIHLGMFTELLYL